MADATASSVAWGDTGSTVLRRILGLANTYVAGLVLWVCEPVTLHRFSTECPSMPQIRAD